ncbi:hypothetical protein HYR53_06585 [Candidatus Acetothermia bacterium]|nr:hypothetical protein [Candidatus Acetothermia bacterium]
MRFITLLLTLALIISSCLPALGALSDPKEAQSTELIAGTAGGAVLGFGSAYLLGQLCLSQTTGLDSIGCIAFILIGYVLGSLPPILVPPVSRDCGCHSAVCCSGARMDAHAPARESVHRLETPPG